jgi:hypothetical protein
MPEIIQQREKTQNRANFKNIRFEISFEILNAKDKMITCFAASG